MGADEFSKSVEMGLKLSKRIYYGKDGTTSMTAPKPASMSKTLSTCSTMSSSFKLPDKHHPTGPMVYAVITDPNIVDNPDITSYQPHVHGRCNPPALIPLQMHGISMNVECYLDTAFVTVMGVWYLYCVTKSACCDCRIAIPLGELGSILDFNVETNRRSYFTKLIIPEQEKDSDRVTKTDGFMMKRNTYTLKVPQVEGGSMIHVKVRWSQKLLYQGDHEFCLNVPFTFPNYVSSSDKTITKRQKVLLNVNSGTECNVTCKFASHPLKEVRQHAGEASFAYEAEVSKWSTQDFHFTYSVCSNETVGGLILQHPFPYDFDQRDMFYFYIFPADNNFKKDFKKEVVFLVDISGSMRDAPLENTICAITSSLTRLDQEDSFNIIVFNNRIKSFSSSLEFATEETITNATEWMWNDLVAEGGTNLMSPLKQAIDMVGKMGESMPIIFVITDGSVDDELDISNMIKCNLVYGSISSPRICTFGIGSYCNHYFLQMLAHMGRGYYDAAYDVESISDQLQLLFDNALSPMLTNVTIDALENLKSFELYPSRIPDLLYRRPLIVSGRYQGKFPDIVKVRGLLADRSSYVIDVKVRNKGDVNLDMICAKREIDILTAQAWLDKNTCLEKMVAKMSIQRGVPSEHTLMILDQNDKAKPLLKSVIQDDEKCSKLMNRKKIRLRNVCVGFGNLKATAENLPSGVEEEKLNEAEKLVRKAASTCYELLDTYGCLKCLSKVRNSQISLAIAELCAALACLELLDCCCDLCDTCSDLC
ncbi:uncharacterized protein [Rutidosis leptorrhynchoides]|uniref:uncharacterized protein n=1 Tax=Rutidosis leptorrhynchoides TaxID=125765 RepID=UPI003A997DF3